MKMFSSRLILVSFLLIGSLASARAELIAYEPFDYEATQNKSGSNGGSGWSSPWFYSAAMYPQTSEFADLYPANIVGRSGNMMFKNPSQTTTINRLFRIDPAQFADGKTVWFSFFLQLSRAPASAFHIGFTPGANQAGGIGITVTPEAGGSLHARISGVVSPASRALGLTADWDPAKRFFIVGRFERVAGGADRLRVWLNPVASALQTGVLPAADLSVDAELVGIPTFFRANNATAAGGDGNIAYHLDEIRLATTLESACHGTTTSRDALLAPPPAPADGVHYYVSATVGNDANPGTSGKPFRTIGRISPFLLPGQVCVVRAGVYREKLRPGHNGEAKQPITYTAAPGETVVLTELDAVVGWTPATDIGPGLWRALCPSGLPASSTQVFFNGAIGYEARWPNRTNDNLMAPQGAAISAGSDETKIVAASLPAGLPANYFDGGIVWALSGKKWSSWRSPVTGFDPATKTITFKPFKGSWVNGYHKPAPGHDNVFYVSGAVSLVDAEREWHYDAERSELVVMPPAGFDPAKSVVEIQTRADAIDLSGLSYIVVDGFKVIGSAANLLNAKNCVLEGVQISYPSFTRGDYGTGYASARAGVMVSGESNTVRECTIDWSWDNGITLDGSGHHVINNRIQNVNLLGTYESGINILLTSRDDVIAWNTINFTGRDGMIPNGINHFIVNNNISNFGSICDDTGGLYIAGHGAGTVIAYNWVHDAPAGMKVGIYFDNFTTGMIAHHNVVWGVKGNGITLNRPSAYHVVAHNTVFGTISNYSSVWGGVRNNSIGTQVANNLITGATDINFGVVATTNLAKVAVADMGFDTATATVRSTRSGLGAGTRMPGISHVEADVAPDIGAFQTELIYPTPGYNASRHPDTWFNHPSSPLVQRLANNMFMSGMEGWTPGPAGTAAIIRDSGFNYPGPEARNSIFGEALSLTGGASVEQVVKNLSPGSIYSLWAFRKASESTTAGLSVIFPDGSEYHYVFNRAGSALNWLLSESFEFAVPADQTEARIVLWMNGPGTVYYDNIGFMQKWPSTELHHNPTRFTTQPVDRSAVAGGSITFTASSALISARTNRWEWRPAGATAWSALSASTGVVVSDSRENPSVTLNPVRPEFNGAAFRCVCSYLNFEAYSRPAVATVTGQ